MPGRLDLIGPPSPVRRLDGLRRAWGSAEIWIKDDAELGPLGGGTKLRNLEFLLGDALACGACGLVVMGLWRSNFIRTVARYARLFGLPVTGLVTRGASGDCGPFPRDFGPGFMAKSVSTLRLAFTNQLVLALGPRLGGASSNYWLPIGGASPVGCLGPLRAALELKDQIASGAMPTPSAIFLPLGSGGTAAGLAAGLRIAGYRGELVAARVCGGPGPRTLGRKAWRTMTLFGRAGTPVPMRIVDARQSMDAAEAGQLNETLRATGLEPDPHYVGPAFHALHGLIHGGALGSTVLFWNTKSRDMETPLAGAAALHRVGARAADAVTPGRRVPCE